ncbi:hypothetical protein DIPPA_22165 [Diplonema papillatum]|nr:hypothetical protein DIPPA_22165 [Diplonema papillatum]
MSHRGDILSVSIGPFASVASAHFWNATTDQDAKQSLLYHQTAGSRIGSKTSSPRLVVVDWAGGSTIKKQWKLHDRQSAPDPLDADEAMDGGGAPMAEDLGYLANPTAPAAGEAPSTVSTSETVFWWKYIAPSLSERTGALVGEADARNFETLLSYGEGLRHWDETASSGHSEHVMDSVRYFFEGMDACQGVNLTVDCGGVFGGVAEGFVQAMRDEVGRKVPVMTTALFSHSEDEAEGGVLSRSAPGEGRTCDFDAIYRWEQQGINRARCHGVLSDLSAAYVPVDVNTWLAKGSWLHEPSKKSHHNVFSASTGAPSLDARNPVETGALASAALSCVFPGVFLGERQDLTSLTNLLRPSPSMKLSTCQLLFPVPLSMTGTGMSAASVASSLDYSKFIPLSHAWPADTATSAPLVAVPQTYVVSQLFAGCGLFSLPSAAQSPEDAFTEHWRQYMRTSRTVSSVPDRQFLLSSTFPATLLPPHLNAFGWHDPAAPAEYTAASVPSSLPVAAHLTTTCASALMLESVRQRLERADKRAHRDQHYEADHWKELADTMQSMVDEYDQGLLEKSDA